MLAAPAGDGDRTADAERAGIQARLHAHNADAYLFVARENRTLDRRGAAVFRQKRGMDVQASEARNVEDGLRKDLPIGGDADDIGGERSQESELPGVAQGARFAHRNAGFERHALHGRRNEFGSPPSHGIGSGMHAHDVVLLLDLDEDACREFRRPHEGYAHWRSFMSLSKGMRGIAPLSRRYVARKPS